MVTAPMDAGPDAGPLAEVIRGDIVESVHLGHLVVLDPSGRPVVQVGNPTAPIWPRSSLKPLQLLAMLRAGLELPDRLLALASASHNGEQFHLEGVLQILGSVGLGSGALRNTPDLPLYPPAALDWHIAPHDGGPGPASRPVSIAAVTIRPAVRVACCRYRTAADGGARRPSTRWPGPQRSR